MKCQNSEFLKLSKDILEKGFSLRFQVRGASMYPFIKSGDTVEIEPKNISKINYADIILYSNYEGKIVIHRVVKKIKKNNETILATRGDFLPLSLREFVPSEKVLGKVVVIRKANRMFRIDRGFLRLLNIVYTKLLPIIRWGHSFGAKLLKFTPSPRKLPLTLHRGG